MSSSLMLLVHLTGIHNTGVDHASVHLTGIDHVGIQQTGVHHGGVLGAPPDPGQGSAPPGADKLEKVLQWLAWCVFALCVAGILIVAGRMAVQHRRGEGGEHVAGLAWVAVACVLAGSASAVVGALV